MAIAKCECKNVVQFIELYTDSPRELGRGSEEMMCTQPPEALSDAPFACGVKIKSSPEV